ncbi:MAG: molybdopterin-dependent oxidoreductase [Candidatus Krumholzibacteriota bacterium]|nr:molybdopterin-dependent oxidoreductase [Candidatus Krumholzibacteriota bacterium]
MSDLHGNCSFCSLACPVIIKGGRRGPVFSKDSILSVEWDSRQESKFGGSLCARGNAIVEFLSHPKRLNYSFVLGERTDFAAAVKETAKNLAEIKEGSGSDSIGVLIGDNLTNEEAALALKFAREIIGTSNIALFAPDDSPLFRAWMDNDLSGLKPAGGKTEGNKRVYLIVGDAFTEHPCTAKGVLEGKRAGRGNEIIVISPEINHTAWFATQHLLCAPGGEAAVTAGLLKGMVENSGAKLTPDLTKLLDGIEWNEIERIGGVTKDQLVRAAASLLGAARVETYISNIFGRIGSPALTSLFAEAATRICPGEKVYEPQFVQQNSWGVYSVLAKAGGGKVFEKLGGSELEALVLLGLDLFSVYPASPVEKALREKKFTVATQLFWGQTASRANVVIPAAGLLEKKGTVSPAFGEDLVREEVIAPPGGAYTDEEFLLALSRAMGRDLSPGGEIERTTARSGSGVALASEWSDYVKAMRELDAAETVLIPWSEAVHAADGSLSRNFNWSDITCPEPELMISEKIAAEMNISGGDRIKVTSEGGELEITARVTGRLPDKVVAATIHFPAVRKLFPWKLDEGHGEMILAPVPVNIDAQGEKN